MSVARRLSFVVVALALIVISVLAIRAIPSASARSLRDVPTGPQQTATAAACATAAQFWHGSFSSSDPSLSCDSSYVAPGAATPTPDFTCSAPDGPVTPCPTPTPSSTPLPTATGCVSGLVYVSCPTSTPTLTPAPTVTPNASNGCAVFVDNEHRYCNTFDTHLGTSGLTPSNWDLYGDGHHFATYTCAADSSVALDDRCWSSGAILIAQVVPGPTGVDGVYRASALFYADNAGGAFSTLSNVAQMYVSCGSSGPAWNSGYAFTQVYAGPGRLADDGIRSSVTFSVPHDCGYLYMAYEANDSTTGGMVANVASPVLECVSGGCLPATATPTQTALPWATYTPVPTGTPAPTGTPGPTNTAVVYPTEPSMSTPTAYCDWFCTITSAGCSLLCPGPLTGQIDPLATAVTSKWGGSSVVAIETALPATGQTACGSRLALNLPTGIQFGSSPPLSTTWHLCPSQESNQALVAIDNILPEGRAFLFILIAWPLLVWSIRYVRNWFRPTADGGGDS